MGKGGNQDAQIERACGKHHVSIDDALTCVEQHKRGDRSFGSIKAGVNLWWGNKLTNNIKNIGLVIGLKNDTAGIWWRLDYDKEKGMHINQGNERCEDGQKAEKIFHPIKLGRREAPKDPARGEKYNEKELPYGDEHWVYRQWRRWTEWHDTKKPGDLKEKELIKSAQLRGRK